MKKEKIFFDKEKFRLAEKGPVDDSFHRRLTYESCPFLYRVFRAPPFREEPLLLLLGEKAPKDAHAFRRALLDDVYVPMGVHVDGLRVDEIDVGLRGHVLKEACSGIDVQAGADDDEDVGLLAVVDSQLDVGNRLAEPHDEGAKLASVASFVAYDGIGLVVAERAYVAAVVGIPGRGDFRELSVKVDDVRASSPFVQIVNVLRDDGNIVVLLEGSYEAVPFVGVRFQHSFALRGIESEHQLRVLFVALGRCHLFHRVLVPQSSCTIN